MNRQQYNSLNVFAISLVFLCFVMAIENSAAQELQFSSELNGTWDNRFAELPYFFQDVFTMLPYEDGPLIGGNMVNSYNPEAPLYYWNGFQYKPLGNAPTNGDVHTIVRHSGDIYIGGFFVLVDKGIEYLAKWNGSEWLNVGPSNFFGNITIRSLLSVDKDLYIAGRIATDIDSNIVNIARWDGDQFYSLGSGLNDVALALANIGTDIYVAGEFTDAGNNPKADRIARWDGRQWHNLGNGLPGIVRTLAVHDGFLYAGGDFVDVDGNMDIDYIARWNGLEWENVGSNVSGGVLTLRSIDNNLYACVENLTSKGRLVKWDGLDWLDIGKGLIGKVLDIVQHEGELFVAGLLNNVGGHQIHNYLDIVRWDGVEWRALGNGVEQAVHSVMSDAGEIYVGGIFRNPEPSIENLNGGIARWDGIRWRNVGTGLNGDVNAISLHGGNLFVGGNFTNAGNNLDADAISRWDGFEWHSLGKGFNVTCTRNLFNGVNTMLFLGNDLYVGGCITDPDGNPNINSIARWDGDQWHSLGEGLNGPVYALATDGTDLYVGGTFTDAGENPDADFIARWDGNQWHSVGSPLSSYVYALSMFDGDLYVGGSFKEAVGPSQGNYIIRWNGSQWHDVGIGTNSEVYSIIASEDGVFIGGDFTDVGGSVEADGLARWDGNEWFAVGRGLYDDYLIDRKVGTVFSISILDNSLYVGGEFTSAGNGTQMLNFGIYTGMLSQTAKENGVTPVEGNNISVYPNPFNNTTNIRFDLSKSSSIRVTIYDILGREVAIIERGNLPTGITEVHWNPRYLLAGTYFYQVQTDYGISTGSLIKLQ